MSCHFSIIVILFGSIPILCLNFCMPDSIKSFISLIKYARRWRPQLIAASIFSILNKIFDIMPEILIGAAVDLVVERDNSLISHIGFKTFDSQILFLGICIFFIWAFESVFQYLYMITWRGLAQKAEHHFRVDTYNHIQKMDISWFERQKTGNVSAIINDDINQLERFLDNGLNEIIQIAVSSLLIGGVFFYVSPLIASVALLPIPVIVIIAFLFQKNISRKYTDVRDAVGKLNANVFNNILGLLTIRSFTAEEYESRRIESLSDNYQSKNRSAIRISSAFVPVIRMAILSGFLASMIIGSYLTINGTIRVGWFATIVFLTQRFLWPFTRLGETVDLFERSMASTKRVLGLLQSTFKIKDPKNPQEIDSYMADINLSSVCFRYSTGPEIISDLDLKIKSGQLTGIVGQTGSGKSTIVKLLLRFYDPIDGSISIGNTDIRELRINDLRTNIGYVSQEGFIFDGTIKENIIYPKRVDDIDTDRFNEAVRLCQIKEFASKLPDEYDTQLGERGQKLSVGQKQRICIARAIYKNPRILILDEATSSVDNETELLIKKSLKEIAKGRTTIVIAHRLSTIRDADTILVIDSGKIAEQGTHDKLTGNAGIYHRLWSIQTGVSDEV